MEKVKKSAYQKLKARNQELIQDIKILVTNKESEFSMEYQEVRHRWKSVFDLEDIVWGAPTNTHNNGQPGRVHASE